jgi:hypothetical protein
MMTKVRVTAMMAMWALSVPMVAFHPGHDEQLEIVYTVDKNGHVKIGTDVRIAGAIVQKGKYAFTHRVDGYEHTVILTGQPNKETVTVVHEIRTTWIPSRDRVRKSALFAYDQPDAVYEVTKIQIAGENGDHVLER